MSRRPGETQEIVFVAPKLAEGSRTMALPKGGLPRGRDLNKTVPLPTIPMGKEWTAEEFQAEMERLRSRGATLAPVELG